MQTCLNCNESIHDPAWNCSHCQWQPEARNEFITFAPALLNEESQFFDKNAYADLYTKENGHFWFHARNELILWAIKKFFPDSKNFLEIGCGTGFVISGVKKKFPMMKLSAADIFVESLPFVQERLGKAATIFQMDGRNMPFKQEFDLIGAFDVLEHIQDDIQVMQQIHKSLSTNGGALFTVPQHPSLWSATDVSARHERRYKTKELQNKLKSCGFEVLFSTSFVALLYPLMVLSRSQQQVSSESSSEFSCGRTTNYILEKILGLERVMIKLGIRFPFGGSRFVVARKIQSS